MAQMAPPGVGKMNCFLLFFFSKTYDHVIKMVPYELIF